MSLRYIATKFVDYKTENQGGQAGYMNSHSAQCCAQCCLTTSCGLGTDKDIALAINSLLYCTSANARDWEMVDV